MTTNERLSGEIKAAMIAKDTVRLGTLRLLKSAVGYLQIEKKTENLDEADFLAAVQREAKKRKDSIIQYEQGGRPELAAAEAAELAVLETFLPKALSPEELEAIVRAAIQETGATGKAQMGLVMKAAQAKAAGRADGRSISVLVNSLLPA